MQGQRKALFISSNKMTPKQILNHFHFYLLFVVLVNFMSTVFLSTGLHVNLIFAFKVIIYLTGILLFFTSIKAFRKESIYFSVYLLTPVFIFVSWLADGLFGVLLGSVFLSILYPPNKTFQDGDHAFYKKFPGFISSCCTYDIVQNKFLILQKKEAEIRITEEHSFTESEYTVANNKGYLKLNIEEYTAYNQPARKIDSTLIIPLK